jgi:retinol dehydrogenase 12
MTDAGRDERRSRGVVRPPVCVVTGAGGGLGEAIATELARAGAQVLAVGRTAERADALARRIGIRHPTARVDALAADLADLDQVRDLSAHVLAAHGHVDVLVLNAAVFRPRRELSVDGFELDFVTNHLSPFLLTHLLTAALRASPTGRVVVVTSSGHRNVKDMDLTGLADGSDFHYLRTYSVTKLLNVLFTTELARRLHGSGVTANAADPGFVRTGLGRDAPTSFKIFLALARPLLSSPAAAAMTPVHLALSGAVASVTGGYFAKCRPAEPSRLARDQRLAERAWELSTRLLQPWLAG